MEKTLEDIIKEKEKWDKYYEDSAKRRQNKISKEEYLAEWGNVNEVTDDITKLETELFAMTMKMGEQTLEIVKLRDRVTVLEEMLKEKEKENRWKL